MAKKKRKTNKRIMEESVYGGAFTGALVGSAPGYVLGVAGGIAGGTVGTAVGVGVGSARVAGRGVYEFTAKRAEALKKARSRRWPKKKK